MDTATFLQVKSISPLFLVSDINRSLEFYTKQLGFEIQFLYEDFYGSIIKNGHAIHLKLAAPLKEERVYRKNNEHPDIIISTEKIDTLYSGLQQNKVAVLQPLREMPYGREFYITDPDDYVIAFIEGKK